jgi:hypothetical protein
MVGGIKIFESETKISDALLASAFQELYRLMKLMVNLIVMVEF